MLKTGDLVRRWNISETTVRGFIKRGWLKCTKTPTGRFYYREEDVEEFERDYMTRLNEGDESDAVQTSDNSNDSDES